MPTTCGSSEQSCFCGRLLFSETCVPSHDCVICVDCAVVNKPVMYTQPRLFASCSDDASWALFCRAVREHLRQLNERRRERHAAMVTKQSSF
jgi:hypothetical protein